MLTIGDHHTLQLLWYKVESRRERRIGRLWVALNGANKELTDAFERCQAYLDENGIDLRSTPMTLGPSLNLDVDREEFVGPFAEEANQLSRRTGREPFVVPQIM
ncbi:hypothetical protein [Novipirellula artificiosorum]|uniref:Uncharacterized protein n=1 Tax=Novipirellula artificiosorum TaxID=2528016 RepID=A0A5C6DAG4_9BACT|nr:hypothetical protein [Novipirellula artificiosorum]TWU31829.1 hypothetical protein Poly41_60640 [Novipirellula artificiosorum]